MGDAHGDIHWNELITNDAEAAKKFYADVMGWSYDSMPMPDGTYHVCKRGDDMVGGLFEASAEMGGDDPHWQTYFAVDDVDASIEKIRAAGGSVVRDPFDVPGVGRIAMVADPTGAVSGIMKPAQQG